MGESPSVGKLILAGAPFATVVLLNLAFQILLVPLGVGGDFLIRTLSNTIFLGTFLLVVFALVQCLRGREADIPTVSEAVRMQIQ